MRYFIFIISVICFCSCGSDNEDNTVAHKMDDGTTFITDGMTYQYSDLETFIGIKPYDHPRDSNVIDRQEWRKDSIYGYDDYEILQWEEVELGNWSEHYGLNSEKKYYVATLKVTKKIPVSKDRTITSRGYDIHSRDSIGLSSKTDRWGFVVSNNNYSGYSDAFTIIKEIKYDEYGKTVDTYIPIEPSSIKWIYYTTENIW